MNAAIILALINAVAALLPQVLQIVPIIESLVKDEKITSAQAAQLWTTIAGLEADAAAEAAAVQGAPPPPAQP